MRYFRRGSVRLITGTDRSVAASVQGSARYSVFLDAEENSLKVRCSCPWYDDTAAVCKHIWATMMAAESAGYLSRLSSMSNPSIRTNQPGSYFDDDLLPPQKPGQSNRSEWRQKLANVGIPTTVANAPERDAGERQMCYLIDIPRSLVAGNIILRIAVRKRKKNGGWGKLPLYERRVTQATSISDLADRRILTMLGGAKEDSGYSSFYYQPDSIAASYRITPELGTILLPEICRTGRCLLMSSPDQEDFPVLAWDEGSPWRLLLEIRHDAPQNRYVLTGTLAREDERIDVSEPLLALPEFVLIGDRVGTLQADNAHRWMAMLRQNGPVSFPEKQKYDFVSELFNMDSLPDVDLPPELRPEKAKFSSPPVLRVHPPDRSYGGDYLECEVLFAYGETVIQDASTGSVLSAEKQKRLLLRDLDSERNELSRLEPLGFLRAPDRSSRFLWKLLARKLPAAVHALTAAGWRVEAEGKLYRRPTSISVEVKTGIDWFELQGAADFEGKVAKLPYLLKAIRRGETMIQLQDGSIGLLPPEWIERYGLTSAFANTDHDSVRFSRGQAGLLDALLASQPEVRVDVGFRRIREQLQTFDGIAAADPQASFVGTLREYQRDGLGWLQFLRKFGFGGCLADDMGLGKTVQVLALLDALRGRSDKPSLVVAPKSLVFNWKEEAARFTPKLRVLDHTGPARLKSSEHFKEFEIVLTTYGTMRRDILMLKDAGFDTVILDEAQAIKNAGTGSAKAARLLQGDHKLALTGTPVENRIGELWSLFEFLNPGLLGTISAFNAGFDEANGTSREVLRRALRPFILRRTKDQVAKDLPPKSEQTIYCEMEKEQKKIYDELRSYYRQTLLKRIDSDGIQKSKMHVLEALLRLRQAACDPALIDSSKPHSSAKLDALVPQLTEVIDEGHKALVFSQFTSFLKILRELLDRESISYEYLDGQTRDRASRIERFQKDSQCRLFLISLKAGGLGLNLTAADYVFLLDPWWNPAVEAQAVDRTHRIGQTRHVFAYRLITRNTVEERVLELQQTKRDLADAIIGAENSVLRGLTREHLELLLS
ncbi:MAG TPA: SNF2-related protein [Terriglobia bacterium]|nr:SNF2-related protein [Terriglobia bacterium]